MKILHVLDHSVPSLSGYSIRSKYILECQKKLGLQVEAVTSPKHSGPSSGSEEINSIVYHRSGLLTSPQRKILSKVPLLSERVLMSALYDRIVEVLSADQFDLIHAHSPVLCGYPALKAARKFGIPVSYEMRCLWDDAIAEIKGCRYPKLSIKCRSVRYLETRLAKKVDAVIPISQGIKSGLIARGVEESKIKCVPNGVDTEVFRPIKKDTVLSKKYGIEGSLVIGFIGSFYRYEGIEYIIRVLPNLLKTCPNIKVLLVGGGEEVGARRERMRLEALVEQLGIRNKIIFTGRVPHSEILSYYSLMDIMIYPRISVRLTESVTPLKPLEAMAMGKSVIGSDIGGLRELIKDGETGLLFQPENVASLVSKCLQLIKNESFRQDLGKRAIWDMLNNRDWSKITEGYLDIYSQISQGIKAEK